MAGHTAVHPRHPDRGDIDRVTQPGVRLRPGEDFSGRVGAMAYLHELSGASQRVYLALREPSGLPRRERADVHLTERILTITECRNS
jgi:hypothetical protein